ncbi:DUF3137 domain-containing protein [uncultured Bacteroides sp.]|uniref:DUF3137 domain-containing protein n=1 Tax=uncultured Bacteroides sp. TaxID=162156 RepID=UPI00261851D7|nr:DUF3137 domain-containing protein [uncultured Bacteroides sp.]
METIDFKALEAELHDELVRVERWRRVVRMLGVAVYSLVFGWFMFVLFGGALLARLGWQDYGALTRTVVPVFIGLVVLSFALTRSLSAFRERETAAMRRAMQAMLPGVRFLPPSECEADNSLLTGSRLFTVSYGDPRLAMDCYGEVEAGSGGTLRVADVGVSYGWMNRWQYHPVMGYVVMVYRHVLRPLFASRMESSAHNFRGMFGWCRTHLEDKAGYLAHHVQALQKRFHARLVRLEDPEFERRFVVYADSEVSARMLLTPAMMRRMTALRDAFGRDLMFSFSRGCLYYAASMPQGFLRLRPASLGGGRMLETVCNDITLSGRVADELGVS